MADIANDTPTKLPLLDRVQFVVRCMGNTALADKLVATLLSTLPTEQAAVRTAIESLDLKSTARLAHRLRGTAVNVCAVPLSQSALELEQAALTNDTDLVLQRWNNLNQHIEDLVQEISSGAKRE